MHGTNMDKYGQKHFVFKGLKLSSKSWDTKKPKWAKNIFNISVKLFKILVSLIIVSNITMAVTYRRDEYDCCIFFNFSCETARNSCCNSVDFRSKHTQFYADRVVALLETSKLEDSGVHECLFSWRVVDFAMCRSFSKSTMETWHTTVTRDTRWITFVKPSVSTARPAAENQA
jgi:hypothetical protein